MSERVRKVNSVIKREISELIMKNANFKPNVFVTISKVDTTSDLRYTRIFVRVIPYSDINYAMKTLEHEKIAIQNMLHKLLGYLRSSRQEHGLLINFGASKLQINKYILNNCI